MILLNYKSLCELASLKETLQELLAQRCFEYLEALLSLLKQRQAQPPAPPPPSLYECAPRARRCWKDNWVTRGVARDGEATGLGQQQGLRQSSTL